MYYVCCVGNIDMIDILEKKGVRFDVRFLFIFSSYMWVDKSFYWFDFLIFNISIW